MYDGNKIIPGLIVFVVLALSPFLFRFSLGQAGARPAIEPPPGGQAKCVESKEYMTSSHMQLLDEWRDAAVRNGTRVYVAGDGAKYDISLQNTCVDCHSNKSKFCDRCHNYTGVDPYCWDCHLVPVEGD